MVLCCAVLCGVVFVLGRGVRHGQSTNLRACRFAVQLTRSHRTFLFVFPVPLFI